jgi:hypothetical protein
VITVSDVVVLNASYEQLHLVSLKHAIKMLVRQVAVVEEADVGHIGPFPRPKVLRLVRYVVMKWRYHAAGKLGYSKAGLLRRDGHRCAYCGRPGADTVDHVLPRSRGGQTGWLNTVAAHATCNQAKGNRTPDEARMPLHWQPWAPTRGELLPARR